MFVVCGEALMDVFAAGDTPTGVALDARVGGSPFNAAVGLARLGQKVAFFSALSKGFLGERLMSALQAEGVDTSAVQRNDAPTTLGLVGLDASGVPSYSFYGDGCADRLLGADAIDRLPAGVRAIHLGSYATVVEPIASTLRALVEREQARVLVAYDPNIRLNVEPDLARWRDMLDWMLPRTHLLKISDEDLQLLLPGTGPEAFAARALAAGVKLVVVTRGAEGALGWTRQAHAGVPPVQGRAGRHRRRRRHLPGRTADLAGRARRAVGCGARRARCRRAAVGAALRRPGRRDHLLAPRRRHAPARRAGRCLTADDARCA